MHGLKSVGLLLCSGDTCLNLILCLGALLLVVGALLGAVLKMVSAAAWTRFVAEVPRHQETFVRSVRSPLNSLGTFQHIFGFILGKAYERYRIDASLVERYRRIRLAYIVQFTLLVAGLVVAFLGSAYGW